MILDSRHISQKQNDHNNDDDDPSDIHPTPGYTDASETSKIAGEKTCRGRSGKNEEVSTLHVFDGRQAERINLIGTHRSTSIIDNHAQAGAVRRCKKRLTVC